MLLGNLSPAPAFRKSAPPPPATLMPVPAAMQRAAATHRKDTLEHTYNDLRALLKLLPAPVRYAMPKPIAMLVARLFYLRRVLPTEVGFDVIVGFCRSLTNIFFREIQVRGC